MTDDRRLELLEGAVRALHDELLLLRSEVAELRSGRASGTAGAVPADRGVRGGAIAGTFAPPAGQGAPPRLHHATDPREIAHPAPAARTGFAPAPTRRAPLRADGATLEALVGRYGTLALATLTILMGVGAFVSWAIANARLGPELRVGLGALLALATAGVGVWLRRQGTLRFGNVLLGLALAIVHVDAWGAGPNLGLVAPAAALAVAAVASVALAALAWQSGEETLFAVGAGGALLAPFVTGSGDGRPLVLLSYGWIVVAATLAALRGRRWPTAARLIGVATVIYAGAGVSAAGGGTLRERLAAPAFALAVAWASLALAGRPHRRALVRTALFVGVVALLVAAIDVGTPHVATVVVASIAALLTATGYAALAVDDPEATPYQAADAATLPLAALAVALVTLPSMIGTTGALLAAGWCAAAIAVGALAWHRAPSAREWLGLAAAIAAGVSIVLAARPGTVTVVVALAALGVLLAVLCRRLALASLAAPAVVALALASVWSWNRLAERPAFAYTPFATGASALAAVVVVAWCAAALLSLPPAVGERRLPRTAAAALAAFVWGRTELAGAGSAEVASFLLTLYYAATGVLAIWAGRRWAAASARHVGLALAIYAALRALVSASDLRSVLLRVGSYLLVGAFLLAVAYWYRAAGDAPADAPPDPSVDAASDAAALPNE